MKRPTLAFLCAAHFLLLILHPSFVAAQPKSFAGYLFAYFEGGGDKNLQEQLRFAVSEDAVNWYALNDNRPVVASDTISNSGGIRDPHILRGEDGCFYIVATDMMVAKNGWKENPGIVLMKSRDLIHWTHTSFRIDEAFPQRFGEIGCAWAPETIYDPEEGKLMVYFTIRPTGRGKTQLFYAYANDEFTALVTEPWLLFEYPDENVPMY